MIFLAAAAVPIVTKTPTPEPAVQILVTLISLCLALAPVGKAAAADYPTKPIRLVVPFAAGGASDTAARSLALAMQQPLGQRIVVDNRPGANGAIAAQAVLGAPADGYTLLWSVASMVALPLMQKSPPFQSLGEFTPVSMIGEFAFCIVVHPGVPAKTIGELVAYARANPDKLSYASSTLAEYMSAAQFMKAAGISMVRVPYKGGAQVMPDLVSGRVQVHVGTLSSALTYTTDGRLRMLAVLLPQRSAAAPGVPTITEAGMPGIAVPTWQAVVAPPKTPQDIADRLAREIARSLQSPELRAQFAQQWLQIHGSTPQALAARIDADAITWQQFTRDNDIKPE
jgi:tripartite-type tricarboxylate transporter receptor subunit TctC